MARPTKLTPETHQAIVSEIASGQFAEVACALHRVSESTYYAWKRRGQEEQERLDAGMTAQERRDKDLPTERAERPYLEFSQAVQAAEATAEKNAVLVVRAAAAEDWKAASWYLERKHNRRWGRVNRNEISGPDGGAVEVRNYTDEDLARLAIEEQEAVEFPGVPATPVTITNSTEQDAA